MRITRLNKKRNLIFACALTFFVNQANALWFFGGPVFDYSALLENINQNLNEVTERIEELKDYKALREVLKSKMKSALSSGGDRQITDIASQQQLKVSSKNHDIAKEMAPIDVPGCFNNGKIEINSDDLAKGDGYVGALFAFIRDINNCEDIETKNNENESTPEVQNINELGDVLNHRTNIVNKIGQLTENSQQIINKYSQVVMEANNQGNQQAAGTNDNQSLDILSRSVSYMTPELPALERDDYIGAKEIALILTDNYKQKYKKEISVDPNSSLSFERVEFLKNLSEEMISRYPYQILEKQINDKFSADQGVPSKLLEMTETGKYLSSSEYIKNIASANDSLSEVLRKKAISRAFRAYIEVERYKQMLEREKELALDLLIAQRRMYIAED
jgi:hypothetical protein